MPNNQILTDTKNKMEKAIHKLKNDLIGIRTGRANPGLVNSIQINTYGSSCPLQQIASVICPEPNKILIKPYDPNVIKNINQAIQTSDLGFNPQINERLITITIPTLSFNSRRTMVARIKNINEETKTAIRNIRRNSNKIVDKAEKNKTLSKDQRDDIKKDIQNLTSKYEKISNTTTQAKEKDIMEI